MNRVIILLSLFHFSFLSSFSQDTIFKKDESVILSKVLEVLPHEIKFKKFNNPDGPIYTMKLAEIYKIVYENGTEELFNKATSDELILSKKTRAQMIIHFGPSFSSYQGEVEMTQRKIGFAGGISIEIPVNKPGNCFDLCLLYEEKGSKFSNQNIIEGNTIYEVSDLIEKLEYITLSASYKRYFGEQQFFFARIGIFGGFLYEAIGSGNFKSTDTGIAKDIEISIKEYYTTVDVGATLGLGFKVPLQEGKFRSDLIFDFRYNISFFDINDVAENSLAYGTQILNSNFVFMAGIRFPF
jgi:hypothetical protein